jgi:dipeptidyl aminopeptidase/acylaminoacyl peptidase
MKRLLYVQQQSIGHIWLASFAKGVSRQLTFDDAQVSAPTFSNTGTRIAYVIAEPHPSGGTSSLVVINTDGGEKNVLLTEEGNVHEPRWSPDGRWIAYAAHRDTIPHDSSRTYLIEVENPGTPREIGWGLPSQWLDDRTLLTQNASGTWTCSIDGSPSKRFFRDSTYAIPVLRGTYILYTDVIPSRKAGVWIEQVSGSGKSPAEPRQLITSLSSYQYDPAGGCVYYMSPQNSLHRVRIPEGKDEVVQGNFPNLRRETSFSLSPDGKSLTYLDSRTIGKMVMIDDFR